MLHWLHDITLSSNDCLNFCHKLFRFGHFIFSTLKANICNERNLNLIYLGYKIEKTRLSMAFSSVTNVLISPGMYLSQLHVPTRMMRVERNIVILSRNRLRVSTRQFSIVVRILALPIKTRLTMLSQFGRPTRPN